MNERKAFQNLPAVENPHFLEDGQKIYKELRINYPQDTNEHLDNILNGLCAALTCLMRENVQKDNHRYFIQLIHSILSRNI